MRIPMKGLGEAPAPLPARHLVMDREECRTRYLFGGENHEQG